MELLSQLAARDADNKQALADAQQRAAEQAALAAEQERQRAEQAARDEVVNKQRRVLDLMLVLDDIDRQGTAQGHPLIHLIERMYKSQYGITVIPKSPTTTNDLITAQGA